MPEVVPIDQYHNAADALGALSGVRAADVLEQDPRLDRPCIELVIGPAFERVPPRVHRVVAEFDFGTRPDLSGSRGNPRYFILVMASDSRATECLFHRSV